MPDTKPGEIGHKMTFTELFKSVCEIMAMNTGNPVLDEPIEVPGLGFMNDIRIEDLTDECDGTCEHPQCLYAADSLTEGPWTQAKEDKLRAEGRTDEGLHFVVTIWTVGTTGQKY